MKEFLIGLIFLIAVLLFVGIGFLLMPLLLVLAFFLRIIIVFALIIFTIWFLGKMIIVVWGKLNK
ncbi:MAG: hypothetical protein KAJ14_01705 [Candidatus Omnitrophica bacterium]|nr:hypothetical protein [Candidatus Omnitrophota bacterium]